MDTVTAKARAMSVMTAPAATKKTPDPQSSEIDNVAQRSLRERVHRQTMPVTSNARAALGNRTAHSFTPKTSMLSADSQLDSGGFPQKTTLSERRGVIQSPLLAMRRAISA